MDFASVILFLILYYIRPQEWITWVAVIRPITLVMAMAIIAMLMRFRGFTIRSFFQTSHDWLMLAYFIWIVVSSPTHLQTLGQVYTLVMFYVVTVQALSNIERIQRFMNWWMIMILVVAALAVASEYGFDPMDSYDLTHGKMKDRLVLNTSIFDNPNALGHGVYPGLLMLYFVLFWRRPVFTRVFFVLVAALPLYCIYLTASKGTFVASFAVVVFALALGRPRVVQILILLFALTIGWAGVKALPRMSELSEAQRNQAIQGRVAAFQFGLHSLQQHPAGIGYERFMEAFLDANHYPKASHSTYVQIGTELGYPGLFLYLALLYCGLRTLLTSTTGDVRVERSRRMLFVLLISYLISGWMVTFTYRATFFLMIGAIAAFHRYLFGKSEPVEQKASVSDRVVELAGIGVLPIQATPALAVSALVEPTPVESSSAGAAGVLDVQAEVKPVGLPWDRFRWLDWIIVIALVYATTRFWGYIMRHM